MGCRDGGTTRPARRRHPSLYVGPVHARPGRRLQAALPRRRLPQRPEDDNEGEIEQGTGELGFFSPHSWWPLFVGLAAATAAMGVAIGWWMFLIGALALLLSVIGFVFEYYRGNYAH